MKKAIPVLFFLISFAAFPQEKREVEKRIDKSEMPEKALLLYDSKIPEKIRRERFYFERDGEKESYEAKFKHKKHRFSIEFSGSGKLQDIEIELGKNEIPETVFKKISDYLETHSNRYNIEKIQGQYVHFEELVFRNKKIVPDNYELVVAVKNKGGNERYELLFDHKGRFVQKRKIVRESFGRLLF